MIPGPLRVPGTDPKTEFEAFDALVTFLIRARKPEKIKNVAAKPQKGKKTRS